MIFKKFHLFRCFRKRWFWFSCFVCIRRHCYFWFAGCILHVRCFFFCYVWRCWSRRKRRAFFYWNIFCYIFCRMYCLLFCNLFSSLLLFMLCQNPFFHPGHEVFQITLLRRRHNCFFPLRHRCGCYTTSHSWYFSCLDRRRSLRNRSSLCFRRICRCIGNNRLWFRHLHMRDQFFLVKALINRWVDGIIYFLLVIKTQFHFSWMYIDVYMFTVNLDMQYYERILVLHGKIFICVFNGSGNDIILGISSIDIIIFKITVSSGNDWFPEKSCDFQAFHIVFCF